MPPLAFAVKSMNKPRLIVVSKAATHLEKLPKEQSCFAGYTRTESREALPANRLAMKKLNIWPFVIQSTSGLKRIQERTRVFDGKHWNKKCSTLLQSLRLELTDFGGVPALHRLGLGAA